MTLVVVLAEAAARRAAFCLSESSYCDLKSKALAGTQNNSITTLWLGHKTHSLYALPIGQSYLTTHELLYATAIIQSLFALNQWSMFSKHFQRGNLSGVPNFLK